MKATFKILALCIALQLMQSIFPNTIEVMALKMDNFNDVRTVLYGLAQLITYQFSHAGWRHLIGNFAFGLPFMVYLEERMGERKFIEFYVLCGIASAALYACMPLSAGGLIGSSGSIFGIMAGACFTFKEGKKLGQVLAMALFAMQMTNQLGMLQLTFLMPGIAFAGHIGGALGAIIALHMGYQPSK